jgi:sulfur carrier protein
VAPSSATINGKKQHVSQGTTILAHLTGLGIDPNHVVVEVNGIIVKKEKFEERLIGDGDRLEILRFVGGG